MSLTIPFFTGGLGTVTGLFGGETPDVRQVPLTISLDGDVYPIDLDGYQHSGVPRFRQGVVTSGEPNDQLLSAEGGWWRYRYSWHLGAGQTIDELDPESSVARFRDSRGVDVWTKYQLCLLPKMDATRPVSTNTKMVSTGTYVYHSSGFFVYRSSDLVTWTAVTGLSGTVQDLTTDGSNCYIATTSDLYSVGVGVGATAVTTATAPSGGYDFVSFVSNRLMASADNVLYEIKPTTIDAVYTHFQDAFQWTVIFAVGSRIYAGGFAGNRSELYTMATTDDGSLLLASEAASFFAGELLQAALSYGGSVVLGTSEGVRFATLAGDANLQYGPVISAPGSVVDIAAQGRFAWFTWEDFPSGGSGVGRMALDEFVDTLLPAYTTDVFTEDVDGDVLAVARFNDRTLFAVESDEIYVQSLTEFVDEGTLDSGDITFGTIEPKSVSSVRMRHSTLDTGESVRIAIEDDFGLEIGGGTSSTVGAREIEVDAGDETINRAVVHLTLAGDESSTPCVTDWRLRGYPVAPGIEAWLVPLIVRSKVVVGDGQGEQFSFDPWERTAKLRQIWQDSEVVRYIEGAHGFDVRIDNFQIDGVEWRDGSDWLEVNCTVRLLSV